MYFHLILTDNCNLCCSYCRAKAFESDEDETRESVPVEIDPDLPVELAIDLPLLYGFLEKDPAPTLTFYGGEPLLRADLIDRIVREAPVQRFMIQTNGLLLRPARPGDREPVFHYPRLGRRTGGPDRRITGEQVPTGPSWRT